jgi:cell division transport system permease protein
MTRFGFFIQEAFRALRRNGAPGMAAIVTTVVTVVLLGVLIPIFQTTQAKSNQIRDELSFRVAVYDDATPPEIQGLKQKLLAIPHVSTVQFVTKGQALKELGQSLNEKDQSLLKQLNSNPLPANFIVKADDASHLDAIRSAVAPGGTSSAPGGQPSSKGAAASGQYISPIVQDVFDRNQDRDKIEQVTGALKVVLTVITALLVIASLMLVGNTIRLSIFARRREVEVMRLVGATRWFIRWPFMIEGVVVGFLGGLVAILVLWLGKVTIVDPLSNTFAIFRAQDTMSFPLLIAILFSAAILVTAIGSGITLRRFLRI